MDNFLIFVRNITAPVWVTCGFLSLVSAVWLLRNRDRFSTARPALAVALLAGAGWALTGAVAGPNSSAEVMGEGLRNLALLFALYRLFQLDGRHASVQPIRPLLIAVAFVAAVHVIAHIYVAASDRPDLFLGDGFQTATLLRLLCACGGLVLVHNLYVGGQRSVQLALRWPAAALLLIWAFDLNAFTVAYLSGRSSPALDALRPLPMMAAGVLLALGAVRGSDAMRLSPSRAITFQSISFLLIGGYLVLMIGIAQWLALVGGHRAATIQVGFAAIASLLALAVFASPRLRAKMRVTVTKHLFQHRYDYRAEWLRFTRTIGQRHDEARERGDRRPATLEERVIRAMADITDSPAGILLTEADHGHLDLAARWRWPTLEVPTEAFSASATRAFAKGQYIADLDEVRAGTASPDWISAVPQWLIEEPRAWALVPLVHYERLVGVVVLARPTNPRPLDWEDFDLLRVVGQQLASYLAEHGTQTALEEAARFDDFNRRIAFVMHDIKNLASQLTLLARNAEAHAENPEFRADMLITLRNSADKLNSLLARLSRYTTAPFDNLAPVSARAVAERVASQFLGRHPVVVLDSDPSEIQAHDETLEQVLAHLIQNAVDASKPDSPVHLQVRRDGLYGVIEVTDTGHGMSPEFVRGQLFRPFVSSKQGGFGIGAYEARELVRAMNGRLDVESREGLGSRFTIRLPLAAVGASAAQVNSEVA